jgi:hypothetical protein
MRRAQHSDGYYKLGMKMVEEQIVREGIKNPAVLKAMREVLRHLFLDPRLEPDAYQERVLPIGYKQTISPPTVHRVRCLPAFRTRSQGMASHSQTETADGDAARRPRMAGTLLLHVRCPVDRKLAQSL